MRRVMLRMVMVRGVAGEHGANGHITGEQDEMSIEEVIVHLNRV